ncbi:cell division protein ZapA [Cognatiyoonia sediminum]|uniref:Cell division protein ZapA n=1 Tax=Cognatiyoonia sediminum TaxID=1508389 RepID=A0A1M5LSG8_9RHOB|nr:cell division protein ZapA [Cognatiyoonia sediminum]SHG68092.1 cell division protein ZapA [Cognatiyoonia sediminum]
MAQVEIKIGGRTFEVACQDGEEHFLQTAAGMLDEEATHLSSQIGRMPEARMLLMAGLMLADKTAGLEDKVKEAADREAQLQARIDTLESQPQETREIPVVPPSVTETLSELAARAEALAEEVERKAR